MDISLKHAVSLMNNVFVSTFKINKNQNLEAVAFKPPGSLLIWSYIDLCGIVRRSNLGNGTGFWASVQ